MSSPNFVLYKDGDPVERYALTPDAPCGSRSELEGWIEALIEEKT
jgi:hypothetical protein